MRRIKSFKPSGIIGFITLFSFLGSSSLFAQIVWFDQWDLNTLTQGFVVPSSNTAHGTELYKFLPI